VYNWSTHQLTEYFTAVSASADEPSAVATAVELAAEMVEAEVGAAVIAEELLGCWGFGPAVPTAGLLAVASGAKSLQVAGLGELHAVSSALGPVMPGALIVARLADGFTAEERQMLQGMAQVLGLALHSIRVLSAERTLRAELERDAAERLMLLDSVQNRRRLLETLLAIQRAISSRRPLAEILDAVTRSAANLLDDAAVALVLAGSGADGELMVASTAGGRFIDPGQVYVGAREAMDTGTLLFQQFDPARVDLGWVIAAPFDVTGETAGSLVAHLRGSGEHKEDCDQLAAFAQQVSLALADARTVEAVHEAHHDSLTGLPNRALFLRAFNQMLASRPQDSEPTSVLFIDLDRFKAINDSLGHEAGDHVLAATADRIRGCIRDGDTAARLGGDEFAVLLPGTSLQAATAVGERVIAAINEPFRVAGRDAFIGASIGVVMSGAVPAGSDELLNNADLAMYRAKKEGKGRVVPFSPHMHSEALEHLSLRGDLQRALTESEFRLQYQPLVRLDTGEVTGVETLVRWHSPVRGLVPPAEFIPIAEETGLIVDIGQWVLATSAAQVANWRATFPNLTLNVNVSGRQLADPLFTDTVAGILTAARLPSSAVTLELTETVLMSDQT
jgi:diguanylate cyclase (GGDEF)-like protein